MPLAALQADSILEPEPEVALEREPHIHFEDKEPALAVDTEADRMRAGRMVALDIPG